MTNGRFIKSIIFVTLFLSLHVLCQPNASARNDASLFGKKWMLIKVNRDAVKDSKAYIEFDRNAKRVNGNGGCNNFSGDFTIERLNVKFSKVIGTQMACQDSSVQQIENNFLKELGRVTKYEIRDNTLRLFRGKVAILSFRTDTSATHEYLSNEGL